MTLHSEQFVVPGAHDFDRVLGAPNFVLVLEALNFLKCLGHSGAEVPRNLVVGSRKVRPFFVFPILCTSPPLQIGVGAS